MRAAFTRRSLGALLLGILAGRNSWDELFRPKPKVSALTLWYKRKQLELLMKKFRFSDNNFILPAARGEKIVWNRYKDVTKDA